MTYLSRRHALVAGLGLCAATLTGTQATARPLIALPDDLVNSDAATITSISTPSPVCAMTFDDGPHPTHTPRLLDMLRERGLKATFYLIGNRVVQYPDIARRIAEEGHEIGNHSWSHPFLNRLSDGAVMREIDQTTNAIFQVTGRPPVTFRPPMARSADASARPCMLRAPCQRFCGPWTRKTGAARGQTSSRAASWTTRAKAASFCPMTSTAARLTPCPKRWTV